MASGVQNRGRVPENLKQKLAPVVRKIQWSYAIFWSLSARDQGVLEWVDGYYNGDIKTRKTIQAVELDANEMGLQRSEQLRELYESLSAGESSPPARRPSAALSPEDLSDTEWYYLVCMSFVFDTGQGLPGKALVTGQPIWLCNAHCADSKIFSRSLLAKSASIQSIVCFPSMDGVVELGSTEQVLEDPLLIQYVSASLLDIPYLIDPNNPNHDTAKTRSDEKLALDPTYTESIADIGLLDMASPDISSKGLEPSDLQNDTFVAEDVEKVAPHVHSWQFMDEEFSTGIHQSLDSSDCISQTFVEHGKVTSDLKDDKSLHDTQDRRDKDATVLEPYRDNLHYQSVLSYLLKTSHQLALGLHFQRQQESSFVEYKKDVILNYQKQRYNSSQQILKKVLFDVPRMHNRGMLDLVEENGEEGTWMLEHDEAILDCTSSQRSQGGKISERLHVLRSMVPLPSMSMVDRISILDDAIDHVKELKRRVEELEPCQLSKDLSTKCIRKPQEPVERQSDIHVEESVSFGKKAIVGKRKSRDIDEFMPDSDCIVTRDGLTDNFTISMNDRDVVIELTCPWRDGLLLEIMEALSSHHLDSHSVQSSNSIDGILSLTIKSKIHSVKTASAEMIKEALRRIICPSA